MIYQASIQVLSVGGALRTYRIDMEMSPPIEVIIFAIIITIYLSVHGTSLSVW